MEMGRKWEDGAGAGWTVENGMLKKNRSVAARVAVRFRSFWPRRRRHHVPSMKYYIFLFHPLLFSHSKITVA